MLNERHLAVIRAALKYWDEEMGTHGATVIDDYLDEPNRNPGVSASDVKSVREFFRDAQLGYVLIESDTGKLLSDDLVMVIDGSELTYQKDRQMVASVLVPGPVPG